MRRCAVLAEPISQRLADHLGKVEDIAPLVRAHADRSERESRLAPEIAEALHETGLCATSDSVPNAICIRGAARDLGV